MEYDGIIAELQEFAALTPPVCDYEKGNHGPVYCKPYEQWQSMAAKAADIIENYARTGITPEEARWVVDLNTLKREIIFGVRAERIKELAEADKDGLVRILPKSERGTCGDCGHFKRIPGKRCGTCEVRPRYTDHWGHIDERRGTFTPAQSRKCCKQYVPREAAEKGGAEE